MTLSTSKTQLPTPKACVFGSWKSGLGSRHSRLRNGGSASLPRIHHAPDLSLLTLADVERAIGRLRHTIRSRDRVVGLHQLRFSGEAICEDLEITRRLAIRHRLERHVVAGLRKRRAIP